VEDGVQNDAREDEGDDEDGGCGSYVEVPSVLAVSVGGGVVGGPRWPAFLGRTWRYSGELGLMLCCEREREGAAAALLREGEKEREAKWPGGVSSWGYL
jgi:hypothetical protein